jgi:hypothetical protein
MRVEIAVQLEKEFYSRVCGCTIPAAWVAYVDGDKIPFADPWEYANEADAMKAAVAAFI